MQNSSGVCSAEIVEEFVEQPYIYTATIRLNNDLESLRVFHFHSLHMRE